MLGYLGVQKYIGTEILKQNNFGIKIYEKNPKTKTTTCIPQAGASVCTFHLKHYLCAPHVVSSCSLFGKHLPMFAKRCMKQCQKKLLNFRMEMQFFATSQRSVSQQVNVCFAGVFETEPQKLCNNERDRSQRGLPSPLLVLLLISSALNIVTEWSPKEH